MPPSKSLTQKPHTPAETPAETPARLARLALHALLAALLARLLLLLYAPLADAVPALAVGSATAPRAVLATVLAVLLYADAASALRPRHLPDLDACDHPASAGLLLATTAFFVLCSFRVGWE